MDYKTQFISVKTHNFTKLKIKLQLKNEYIVLNIRKQLLDLPVHSSCISAKTQKRVGAYYNKIDQGKHR